MLDTFMVLDFMPDPVLLVWLTCDTDSIPHSIQYGIYGCCAKLLHIRYAYGLRLNKQ